MSRSSKVSSGGSDLWTILEQKQKLNDDAAKENGIVEELTEKDENFTILFLGESSAGKSSLIQGFLKPNATLKDPKPTVALEYNFARKKATGGKGTTKVVSNIWELGGDSIQELKLVELALTSKNIQFSSVVIVVDLSKPAQVIAATVPLIEQVRDVIRRRLAESKNVRSLGNIPASEKNPLYKDHVDEARVDPCEIPLFIVANKYDTWKSSQQAEKRLSLQLLRFLAHYHGATLFASSATDPTLKESYRNFLSTINFRGLVKQSDETSTEKPFFVTPGQDNFEFILLGKTSNDSAASTQGKSKLMSSTQDLSLYLSSSGLTKDCWARLAEHARSVFGDPEIQQRKKEDETEIGNYSDSMSENPEAEVDAMRSQRDLLLEKYIQEMERKEAMLLKLNASEASSSQARGNDEADEFAAVAEPRRSRK